MSLISIAFIIFYSTKLIVLILIKNLTKSLIPISCFNIYKVRNPWDEILSYLIYSSCSLACMHVPIISDAQIKWGSAIRFNNHADRIRWLEHGPNYYHLDIRCCVGSNQHIHGAIYVENFLEVQDRRIAYQSEIKLRRSAPSCLQNHTKLLIALIRMLLVS